MNNKNLKALLIVEQIMEQELVEMAVHVNRRHDRLMQACRQLAKLSVEAEEALTDEQHDMFVLSQVLLNLEGKRDEH